MEKSELKPAGVFHFFNEICQVPRPSKKEYPIAFRASFSLAPITLRLSAKTNNLPKNASKNLYYRMVKHILTTVQYSCQ